MGARISELLSSNAARCFRDLLGPSGGVAWATCCRATRVILSSWVLKKAYIFGRGPDGGVLLCFCPVRHDKWQILSPLPHLRDSDGWDHRRFWRTIQVVKLGTKLYVWGRGAVTFHIFSFCTISNAWEDLPGLYALGDNAGWSADQYNDTLQLVVVGHKLYLWGRGRTDCVLFSFDTITKCWESCIPANIFGLRNWLALPDAAGWDRMQHFHTIRVVAIGLVIYVWVRGMLECQLHSFDTRTRRWDQLPSLVAFLDQDGWDQAKYYSTIQVVPVGRKLFVWARGIYFLHLYAFDTVERRWHALPRLRALCDDEGWGAVEHYCTMQVVALSGSLYVFARGMNECYLHCFDTRRNTWTRLADLRALRNAEGWQEQRYRATIQVATLGSKLCVWGRGLKACYMYEFDTATNVWREAEGLNGVLTDAAGWSNEKYYGTLHFIGSRHHCRRQTFARCEGPPVNVLQDIPRWQQDILCRTNWVSDGKRWADYQSVLFKIKNQQSQEFAAVSALLLNSLPKATVHYIQRVENGALQQAFQLQLDTIKRQIGPDYDDGKMVRMLFHGTSAIQDIVQSTDGHGFLPLLSSSASGRAHYGDGTYFAVDCRYSHNGGYVSQLPNGLYQVLVVAVVVGRSALGVRGMKRLPPVPGCGPHMRVNSLVDNPKNPKIYVVQHSNQAYPAFVITYSFHDVIDLSAL